MGATARGIDGRSAGVVIILAIGVFILASVLTAAWLQDFPIKFYTRDPASESARNLLLGVLSNAGLVFWSAAASVALLTAFATPMRRPFFVFAGLFSILLLCDDALQLHEQVIPWLLGLPEKVVFGVYGLLVAAFVLRHRKTLTGAGGGIFIAAMAGFGLSIALDVLSGESTLMNMAEDLPKFVGIVLWFAYFFDQALRTLVPLMRR